jgi:transposase
MYSFTMDAKPKGDQVSNKIVEIFLGLELKQILSRDCAARFIMKPSSLKQWRGIATRYDKTARSFAAMISPIAAVMARK